MTSLDAWDYALARLFPDSDSKSESWQSLLPELFPQHTKAPFALHHKEFWDWVWSIKPSVMPDPFCGVWARGGAKSSSAEMACVILAARRVRHYVLYVSGVQDQADDHVANVGELLMSPRIAERYPDLASRSVGKYGESKGWRRNRLRTASGFTIDAIGLDTAARGVRQLDQRPDALVLDDIDSEDDTLAAVAKKIRRISQALLPAGSSDVAVLAIQNVIHDNSVFAQLADGRAEFLTRRIVSGPIPAVRNLEVVQRDGRWRIVSGEPTWAGQNLDVCQSFIDLWGYSAFMREAQHETEPPAGGMFDHLDFERLRVAPSLVPQLERTVVWCDPSVTDTDQSDSHGVQVDGLAGDGKVYRLRSWEQRATPLAALVKAIVWAVEFRSTSVGIETDQGGDTWQSVFREAVAHACRYDLTHRDDQEWARRLAYRHDKASRQHGQPSKQARAARMLTRYETDVFRHVEGTHTILERALRRFPLTKPLDLVDAAFWSQKDLLGDLPEVGAIKVDDQRLGGRRAR